MKPLFMGISPLMIVATCVIMALVLSGCGTERRTPSAYHTGGENHDASTPPTERSESPPAQPESQCPNPDHQQGFAVDDVMPSLRMPNAEWEGASLRDLCGSRAILVISSAEW